MSKMGAYLPKGVTLADIEKAVNEPPPPPEAPAAAPDRRGPRRRSSRQRQQLQYPQPRARTSGPASPGQAVCTAAGPGGDQGPQRHRGGSDAPGWQPRAGLHRPLRRPFQYFAERQDRAGRPRRRGQCGDPPGIRRAAGGCRPSLPKETGKAPAYGEMSRGNDVQNVYWEESAHGTKYAAASPGHSQHQKGLATDLPDSGFRKWLVGGNMDRFGLHFPVKNDAPHIQMNAAFKGNLATGARRRPGTSPGTPEPADPGRRGPCRRGGSARAADAKAIVSLARRFAPPAAPARTPLRPSTRCSPNTGPQPCRRRRVIKTESNWNPQAAEPGKGTYRGLTQIGPDTFNGGGWQARRHEPTTSTSRPPRPSRSRPMAAMLDHYGFADKAKAAGIDFSKMSPAAAGRAFAGLPVLAGRRGLAGR